LEQKSVTSWLDLRNKAAHGQYSEYDAQQVRTIMIGVTDFMNRGGGGLSRGVEGIDA